MKNGFFAVLAIPLLFANIAMASNENTSSVPYTVVKVEEGEQYHFTKSVPDSSGNLNTEYYKINLDPSKFSTTGNLSWSKVYNDGPDTIAVKLPNNKIEYYKYTVVNPDRIYNTPSYNALTDQNDYIGINNTSFSSNDKEVNSLNNDFISNTNPGPYGGFENRGHIENLSGAFIDNLIQYEFGYVHAGAAVFNSGTIDNLDGIFINNAAPHGAVALFSINSNHDPVIIRNIRGTFISNGTNKNADYTAYSGAIHLGYNSHVDKIEGNFINNSASAATIFVDTDQTSVGEITGNFIGNTGPVEEPYPNGFYINGNNVIFNRTAHIGLINGSFVDNNAVSIYNNGEIQKISSEFINNKDSAIVNYYANIESIEKSNFVGNHGTYIGGAIYNHLNGNIGKISNCNFIGNSVKEKGGAIYNEKSYAFNNGKDTSSSDIGSISANFIGNHVEMDTEMQNGMFFKDENAQGGAVWTYNDLTFLSENNTVNVIKNNYTLKNGVRDDNAIYAGDRNTTITFKQLNGGEQYLYDNVRGENGYKVNVIGDGSGAMHLYNDMYGATVSFNNANIDTINNNAHDYNFAKFTLNSNSNFGADVDLANNRMDRISAESYGEHNGNLNVNNLNLLSYANSDKTSIKFADEGLAYNVTNSVKEINTPIFKYGVSYKIREDSENLGQNAGYFEFERSGGGSSNKADSYNPAVLTQPTASQTGVQTNIDTTFSYAFNNVDTYTLLPSFERFARMNENKYAFASTDFNSNINYSENNSEKSNAGIWVKPYTSFERIPLHNGPKVDAITYGTLIGYDSKFKHHRYGWHSVTTPYAGYNGGQIKYSGADITMNGGLLGLTESFYKGNFWTAISANVGASNAETSSMYGKEDSTSLFAAIASKTGYNFEFKDGKYIVQPNFMINYSFINTFDYKNAAGVKIDSQPLHTIQINPGVRFIANFENGWQPYLTAGMVWNLLNETHATANGYKLPSMHIKPYFEYGLGLQKLIADRHTGFIQAVVRNGGRNGVVLTLGFRTKIGAEPSSSKNKSSRTEIKK